MSEPLKAGLAGWQTAVHAVQGAAAQASRANRDGIGWDGQSGRVARMRIGSDPLGACK